MKLEYTKRSAEKKSQSNQLRKNQQIPSVLYVRGKPSEPIAVQNTDFTAYLKQIPTGRLPTTVFTLVGEDGKEIKCIVKGIQYHITTYEVIHLDFEELHDDVKINVRIPIECTGIVDCVGIKLGGVLRQVIRHLKVSCYPKDMPKSFELDVRNLKMKDKKRLADIDIPANVKPLMPLKEVAVVIVKR